MRFTVTAFILMLSVLSTACYNSVSYNSFYTDPNDPNAPCGYDPLYGYYCYSEGNVELSKDLTTSIAQVEQAKLEVSARHFARQFELSADQGMKIAQSVRDYNALQTRSDQDAADFARRLYGIEPARIVQAVSQAQMGDITQLDAVIADAAKNFNTTQDNMRKIVKALHGQMIREQGLSL
jgi:hypothetical protein